MAEREPDQQPPQSATEPQQIRQPRDELHASKAQVDLAQVDGHDVFATPQANLGAAYVELENLPETEVIQRVTQAALLEELAQSGPNPWPPRAEQRLACQIGARATTKQGSAADRSIIASTAIQRSKTIRMTTPTAATRRRPTPDQTRTPATLPASTRVSVAEPCQK